LDKNTSLSLILESKFVIIDDSLKVILPPPFYSPFPIELERGNNRKLGISHRLSLFHKEKN
jgi:hypothetical protein